MALQTCAECSHSLSTAATACPHCGAQNKRSFGEWTLRIVVGLAVVWLLLYLIGTLV